MKEGVEEEELVGVVIDVGGCSFGVFFRFFEFLECFGWYYFRYIVLVYLIFLDFKDLIYKVIF